MFRPSCCFLDGKGCSPPLKVTVMPATRRTNLERSTHTIQMNPFKPRTIRMLERTVKATHRKPSVFTCYASYLVVEFPGLRKVLLLTILLQTPEKMHTQPLRLISKALLLHLPGNRSESAGRKDRGASQGVGQIGQLNLSNG